MILLTVLSIVIGAEAGPFQGLTGLWSGDGNFSPLMIVDNTDTLTVIAMNGLSADRRLAETTFRLTGIYGVYARYQGILWKANGTPLLYFILHNEESGEVVTECYSGWGYRERFVLTRLPIRN